LHEKKLKWADKGGKLELVNYYKKEIEAKKEDKRKKEKLLKR